jgi:hypothetical protein
LYLPIALKVLYLHLTNSVVNIYWSFVFLRFGSDASWPNALIYLLPGLLQVAMMEFLWTTCSETETYGISNNQTCMLVNSISPLIRIIDWLQCQWVNLLNFNVQASQSLWYL